jgi:large subunit ribosomal protein L17
MRHGKVKFHLARPTDQRIALMRSLTRSLFEHKKIVTTIKRAKAASRMVDRAISLAKRGDLTSKRRLISLLPDKKTYQNVMAWSVKVGTRQSGFTRVVPMPARRGDNAAMAVFEMVDA